MFLPVMRRVVSPLAIAAVFLLTGCGEQPPRMEAKTDAPKKPAVPEGPIPALTAYYEVYKAARTIAPDLQTASITGNEVEGVTSGEGKYPRWTVVFVSASRQQAYSFLYSTVEKDNILKGLNNQGAMRWAGPTQSAEPFSNSDFSVDSVAAFHAAAEKAKGWLAKNPDKKIATFALGHAARFPAPMWYIMWGTPKNGFAAYVNASTGLVAK